MDLQELRTYNRERDLEWDPHNTVSTAFRAVELSGEVGELMNVIKKILREANNMPGSRTTREDLEDELADVLIGLDLLAMEWDIDLSPIVKRKFNATSKKYNLATRIP